MFKAKPSECSQTISMDYTAPALSLVLYQVVSTTVAVRERTVVVASEQESSNWIKLLALFLRTTFFGITQVTVQHVVEDDVTLNIPVCSCSIGIINACYAHGGGCTKSVGVHYGTQSTVRDRPPQSAYSTVTNIKTYREVWQNECFIHKLQYRCRGLVIDLTLSITFVQLIR